MSKQHRPQTPKPRNEAWIRARLEHSNRNNTVPSGKKYSRKVKYRANQYV